MSTFKLNASWTNDSKARTAIEITIASLSIILGEKHLTSYRTSQGKEFASLRIPTYYVAEWIAENWWPLLYEPRKGDNLDSTSEPDTEEFLDRHSLLAAQHGFALPAVLFIPVGRALRISAVPRIDEYADAEFRARGFGVVPRDEVMSAFDRFVSGTIQEMSKHKITETPLQEAWNRVKNTTKEEREFCELIGSLGLCPYFVDDAIAAAIDTLVDILGSRATRDFCFAASSDTILKALTPVETVAQSLTRAQPSSLTPILNTELPPENFAQDSWIRGLTAGMRVASALHISPSDQKGADRVFELLRIDTTSRIPTQNSADEHLPFSGAVDRQESSFQTALLQEREDDRRFAAARSVYLAWVSEQPSRRLVTQARTRDQQASRQFAAELLVPREYLRAAAEGGVLYDEQVREIARLRKANPAVVAYQANNMGLSVAWG